MEVLRREVEKRNFSVVDDLDGLSECGREVYIRNLLDLVKSYILHPKPPEMKSKIDGGYVTFHVRGISKNESLTEDLESLVKSLFSSEELREAYRAYQCAWDDYLKKVSEFEYQLKSIAREVLHGTPLRRSCNNCPKVLIARDP